MVKELLEVRKKIKSRKPKFRRQQINQFAKFKKSKSWRRPKGMDSKMRLQRKGHRKMPTVGFGSPNQVRGLNREGFREVLVYNVLDLQNINKKEEIVVIGQTVGKRKRLLILEECKKIQLKVSNYKDIDVSIEKISKKNTTKSKNKKASLKDKKDDVESKDDTKKDDSNKKEEKKVESKKTKTGGSQK